MQKERVDGVLSKRWFYFFGPSVCWVRDVTIDTKDTLSFTDPFVIAPRIREINHPLGRLPCWGVVTGLVFYSLVIHLEKNKKKNIQLFLSLYSTHKNTNTTNEKEEWK